MAQSADARAPSAIRLQGTLAPATVIGNNGSATQRVYIAGAKEVHVVYEASSITSTPDIDFFLMLADTVFDDTKAGTRRVESSPSQTQITETEKVEDITSVLDGEHFLEIKVTCGGAEACTIDHIDVFTKLT